MIYPSDPVFLLDENTSPPSGGAPSSAPASGPPGGTEGGAGGASAPQRIPDSPDEPAPDHSALDGMEDNDFDLVEVSVEPTPGEGGEPQPQPAPVQPPAQQPATAAQSAPQQPAQQQPGQPAANVPSAPRSPLEQAIEGFRTNHTAMSDWASKNLFSLSKEDAELLETDAVTAIPVLMGRVYSQALQATTNLIKNFVPEMVNSGVQTTTARAAKATEALNEFYQANPHLNHQAHGQLVDKWARSFRAANPGASRAEAIKFVGNAVSAELGITPAAAGANGASRRPAPFAPARPGTRVQQPTPQHDPYEGMDLEFDN
jgi:hypothetical protein